MLKYLNDTGVGQLKEVVDAYVGDSLSLINNAITTIQNDITSINADIDSIESDYVRAFDTVADMQADTDLKAGMTCHTNGFHVSGDGGAAYYTVSTTGTANGMDVLALQGGLVATLVVTESYVTPEQLGAWGDGAKDDTAILQHAINEYINVRLQGLYVISDTLQIHDLENGWFGGVAPFSSETLTKVASVGLYCSGMVGKAAISLCGCLNYELKNFGIFPLSDVTTDGPSIGIYCGRSASHLSSQWNNIIGVGIQLGDGASLNGGNGSICIYNNAAEEFSIKGCTLRANIGVVHTDQDCLSLASLGNGYAYQHATCSVIRHSDLSICCETAFLMSHVSSLYFDDLFYANVDNYSSPSLFKSDLTNSTANYWTNIQVIRVSAEQNVSALKLITIGPHTLTDNVHIENSMFEFYSTNSSANNYLAASSTMRTIFVNTYFYLKDNQAGSNVIFDASPFLCNFTGCYFYTRSNVNLTNCMGTFSSRPNQESTKYGTYGGDMNLPQFPFHVSGRVIGVSWAAPTLTGCANGSLCLCTNPDSNVALWVYKNGWKTVNIDA